VRQYTIKKMDGLITFTCQRCTHSVTLLDFSSQNGSRRTQAATAMHEHAAAAHSRPVHVCPPDAQVWHAR